MTVSGNCHTNIKFHNKNKTEQDKSEHPQKNMKKYMIEKLHLLAV